MPYITTEEECDSYANYYLALAYQSGDGVPYDIKEAERLLRLAADAYNIQAMIVLARLYKNGVSVKEDHVEAAKFYNRAAMCGNNEAQYELGHLYMAGIGVKLDSNKAFEWWKEAAIGGNTNAHIALLTFLTSVGDKDAIFQIGHKYYMKGFDHKAIEFWEKGAELNDPNSQYNLGTILYNGQRRSEGAELLQKAADAGHVEAKKNMDEMYSSLSDVDSVDSLS